VLTTQLYFPGEPRNDRDGLFTPELLVELSDGPDLTARFDTILDMA
jgi:protocatechuate 3,4-dioxygenase beta subunit